jgi:hypothetical protein
MKGTFFAFLAAAVCSIASAKEIQPNALLSEIYDSGEIHNELMSRKKVRSISGVAGGRAS